MTSALATEWCELGGLGRVAAAALVLSGVVAIMLGSWIEAAVRHHLLEVRTEVIQGIIDELAAEDVIPLRQGATVPEAAIDAAVEHRLTGGEAVGVAVRDASGAVVHGDAVTQGLPGPVDVSVAHVEQHADGLLHLRLPVRSPDGRLAGAFEVSQEASGFNSVVSGVRRKVWLAITGGLATLAAAMGALTWSNARALDRRRRHAERLLRELLRAEDEERHRIVGSLHDDVGQPLYRLLYGLEGCRTRLDADSEVAEELERLSGIVRDVDRTLRAELHLLHRSSFDAPDLTSALEATARDCRDECGLRVGVEADLRHEPSPVPRSVLLRAVQEGLVNVRKHAAASSVRIHATGNDRRITIEVIDDGRGSTGTRGVGLTTTAERLDAIGGGLSVDPGPARGTVLRVWAPLHTEVAP